MSRPMVMDIRRARWIVLVSLAGTVVVGAESPDQSTEPAPLSSAQTASDLNTLGVQEAQAGRFQQGIDLLRAARQRDPTDLVIRKNLSGVLTDWATHLEQQGHLDQALALLKEAVECHSDNATALKRLGDLFYIAQGDFEGAVAAWKDAYGKVSSAERQVLTWRIAQAERDRRLERGFAAFRTTHFSIRFEGNRPTEGLTALSQTLEQEYERLASLMGKSPPHVAVIVYAAQDFQRVIDKRDWALGLYDGRLRLRLDELQTTWLRPIIAHELVHAVLAYRFGSRLPIWLHEGLAQALEPAHPLSDRQQQLLERLKARTAWVPLKWLDRRFEQPSALEDVELAYLQARLVMEFLLARYGMERMVGFLTEVARGQPMDQTFDQTFAPSRWAQLEQGLLDW